MIEGVEGWGFWKHFEVGMPKLLLSWPKAERSPILETSKMAMEFLI